MYIVYHQFDSYYGWCRLISVVRFFDISDATGWGSRKRFAASSLLAGEWSGEVAIEDESDGRFEFWHGRSTNLVPERCRTNRRSTYHSGRTRGCQPKQAAQRYCRKRRTLHESQADFTATRWLNPKPKFGGLLSQTFEYVYNTRTQKAHCLRWQRIRADDPM